METIQQKLEETVEVCVECLSRILRGERFTERERAGIESLRDAVRMIRHEPLPPKHKIESKAKPEPVIKVKVDERGEKVYSV